MKESQDEQCLGASIKQTVLNLLLRKRSCPAPSLECEDSGTLGRCLGGGQPGWWEMACALTKILAFVKIVVHSLLAIAVLSLFCYKMLFLHRRVLVFSLLTSIPIIV